MENKNDSEVKRPRGRPKEIKPEVLPVEKVTKKLSKLTDLEKKEVKPEIKPKAKKDDLDNRITAIVRAEMEANKKLCRP